MSPYRFAVWNLLDSLGWSVSVAASAYGLGRLATGHHTGHDIAILAIGLGAGVIVAVAATRRHSRRAARHLSAVADRAPKARPDRHTVSAKSSDGRRARDTPGSTSSPPCTWPGPRSCGMTT